MTSESYGEGGPGVPCFPMCRNYSAIIIQQLLSFLTWLFSLSLWLFGPNCLIWSLLGKQYDLDSETIKGRHSATDSPARLRDIDNGREALRGLTIRGRGSFLRKAVSGLLLALSTSLAATPSYSPGVLHPLLAPLQTLHP